VRPVLPRGLVPVGDKGRGSGAVLGELAKDKSPPWSPCEGEERKAKGNLALLGGTFLGLL